MAFDQAMLKAGGDINPSRFVTLSDSRTVVESNSGDQHVLGVSHESAKEAPQSGASTLAAEDGDPIKVYGPGDVCLVQAGGAIDVSSDAFVKPDNSGDAVAASTSATATGIALEDAADGELFYIMVIPPTLTPA